MYKMRNFNIHLSKTQQKIFKIYFEEELKLYNTLNSTLSKELKLNHNGFLEIINKLRLFGECIEHGIDLRTMDEPHPRLEGYEFDYQNLSQKALAIMDSAKIKSLISPRAKRNMGVHIFKHYAQQCRNFSPSGDLVKPLLSLPQFTLNEKRHVQLHRKAVIVKYDTDKNISSIITPYIHSPLYISGNIKKFRWDILIIHQAPNVQVDDKSPWLIDFQESNYDYLLDYVDNITSSVIYNNNYRTVSF